MIRTVIPFCFENYKQFLGMLFENHKHSIFQHNFRAGEMKIDKLYINTYRSQNNSNECIRIIMEYCEWVAFFVVAVLVCRSIFRTDRFPFRLFRSFVVFITGNVSLIHSVIKRAEFHSIRPYRGKSIACTITERLKIHCI